MRVVPLLLAAGLVALFLVPAVGASHNMGHRYLVYGRLLDASGMPVQNQQVEIRLSLAGNLISSIVTQTDCVGDFDSWKGRKGPSQGPVQPGDDGYGEIEEIPAAQGRPAYSNFHFHDPHLSSQHKFELRIGSDTLNAGFVPKTRQTGVYRQLAGTYPAACGNYDEFNGTFELRTYIAHADEMTYTKEPEFRPRTVDFTYGNPIRANMTVETDFMYTAVAQLNVVPQEGDTITIGSLETGNHTFQLGPEQVKYRRHDKISVLGGDLGGGGTDLSDFRFFGIVVLVGAIGVGAFWAGSRMKAKYEEKRLRETTTRRRFRRDRPPENP